MNFLHSWVWYKKQTTEIHDTIYDSTSEHNFPYPVIRTLVTTPNLLSQAHFHHILSTRFHKTVHHIGQQVIKHTMFFSFIQLQYVLPLKSTSRLLAVCCNRTPKIQCTARLAWSLCSQLSLVYKWNQKIHKWNCFSCGECPMLHFLCNMNPSGERNCQQVQCWLQCIGQLLTISSDFNIRGVKIPWRWVNLDVTFDFKICDVKINSNGNVMKQNSNHTPTIIFIHICCFNQINHTSHFVNTKTLLLLQKNKFTQL